MGLQTPAEPPIKDAAGGGWVGGGGIGRVLDVDDHFEGKRREQTCGRKDLKHHTKRRRGRWCDASC